MPIFAPVALSLALVACRGRGGMGAGANVNGLAADGAASRTPPGPSVTCMVYRPCGCRTMCAGVTVARDQLAPGLELPIVAGDACGERARVETALDREGHVTLILGSAAPCDHRCAMAVLQAVDPTLCLGRCDRCPSVASP